MRIAVLLCLFASISVPGFGQNTDLDRWMETQVKAHQIDFVRVVDTQQWLQAPIPKAYVVLGLGEQIVDAPGFPSGRRTSYPIFVLLAQSESGDRLTNPKAVSFLVVDNDITPDNPQDFRVSIDVAPFQIRKNEYVFGVKHRWSLVGNKSGVAYDVFGLVRLDNGEMKEIYRDITWAFSKYESGPFNCYAEAVIASEPSQREFFNIVRRPQDPQASCRSFPGLQFPNTQVWDPAKGVYMDSSRRMFSEDDMGKGVGPGRDR
jgi:hypothetical protein